MPPVGAQRQAISAPWANCTAGLPCLPRRIVRGWLRRFRRLLFPGRVGNMPAVTLFGVGTTEFILLRGLKAAVFLRLSAQPQVKTCGTKRPRLRMTAEGGEKPPRIADPVFPVGTQFIVYIGATRQGRGHALRHDVPNKLGTHLKAGPCWRACILWSVHIAVVRERRF